jgi:hypothetical protein
LSARLRDGGGYGKGQNENISHSFDKTSHRSNLLPLLHLSTEVLLTTRLGILLRVRASPPSIPSWTGGKDSKSRSVVKHALVEVSIMKILRLFISPFAVVLFKFLDLLLSEGLMVHIADEELIGLILILA